MQRAYDIILDTSVWSNSASSEYFSGRFLCECCGCEVILAHGSLVPPYFRHARNVADESCENYVAGLAQREGPPVGHDRDPRAPILVLERRKNRGRDAFDFAIRCFPDTQADRLVIFESDEGRPYQVRGRVRMQIPLYTKRSRYLVEVETDGIANRKMVEGFGTLPATFVSAPGVHVRIESGRSIQSGDYLAFSDSLVIEAFPVELKAQHIADVWEMRAYTFKIPKSCSPIVKAFCRNVLGLEIRESAFAYALLGREALIDDGAGTWVLGCEGSTQAIISPSGYEAAQVSQVICQITTNDGQKTFCEDSVSPGGALSFKATLGQSLPLAKVIAGPPFSQLFGIRFEPSVPSAMRLRIMFKSRVGDEKTTVPWVSHRMKVFIRKVHQGTWVISDLDKPNFLSVNATSSDGLSSIRNVHSAHELTRWIQNQKLGVCLHTAGYQPLNIEWKPLESQPYSRKRETQARDIHPSRLRHSRAAKFGLVSSYALLTPGTR